jgi:uncharacterized UPF0160 family protein
MNKSVTIVTHSGSFHSDDVFAVAALSMHLRQLGATAIEIVRSRDPEVITEADYVLDVGGVYDPAAGRFDHHQEEGAGQRENGIPYAAFGLVWQEVGKDLCADDQSVADMLDQKLVQAIDGPDNGVSLTGPAEIEGAYPYFLGSAVNIFRPTWREESDQTDEIFFELVEWATVLLKREITVAGDRAAGARQVETAYQAASDKRLIWLKQSLPHRSTLLQHPEPLFVVYPKDSGRWRLRAVIEDNFEPRATLPENWRGKRGKALQEATGVDSAVFCHASLPMIVTTSKEGIEKLAQIALDQ